jgi:hypothetical protein
MTTESSAPPVTPPAETDGGDDPMVRARLQAEEAWAQAYGVDPTTGEPVKAEDDGQPQPSPPPQPPPPPPSQPQPQPQPQGEKEDEAPSQPESDVERRFREMQEQHARELRRRDDTIAGMRGNLDQLRGQIDLLARQRQEPQKKEDEPETPRLVTDDEVKAYGTDFFDVVHRFMQQTIEPVLHKMAQRLEHLETQTTTMGRHVGAAANMTLSQYLTQHVGPDWNQQDKDPRFIAWLQQDDVFSGVQRLQLLRSANSGGNADRVAAFFNAYRKETGEFAPKPNGSAGTAAPGNSPSDGQGGRPSASAAANGSGGKVDLRTLVAPGRPKTGAGPQPGGGTADTHQFSEDEVNDFYKRKKLGLMKKADADAYEKRLALAMAEGRVEVRPRY